VIELVKRRRPTIFFAVPTFTQRFCVRRKRRIATRIFLRCGNAFRRETRFLLRFLSAGENDSASRFWMESGRRNMLHMFISSRPGKCKPGSCGFPCRATEVKIVDDNGRSWCVTARSETLWVRGAQRVCEYWRIPELTARTKRGEWVVTGDKFFCDSEGYYQLLPGARTTC